MTNPTNYIVTLRCPSERTLITYVVCAGNDWDAQKLAIRAHSSREIYVDRCTKVQGPVQVAHVETDTVREL